MKRVEVPPPDQHTTHCRIRWKVWGKLVPCDHAVEGDRQLCSWPGSVCPIYWSVANEKQRKALAFREWRRKQS
jgi:hypothetical protein